MSHPCFKSDEPPKQATSLVQLLLSCVGNPDMASHSATLDSAPSEDPLSMGPILTEVDLTLADHTSTDVLAPLHNEDDLNDDVSTMDEENILEKNDAEIVGFMVVVDPDHEKENRNSTPRKRAYDGVVPCIGMEFGSLEEFERSYYTYAQSEGFTVRIKKTLKETKNGHFMSGFKVGVENSKEQIRKCKTCGECGHYSASCEQRKKPMMAPGEDQA